MLAIALWFLYVIGFLIGGIGTGGGLTIRALDPRP
jgi:hypothetical protein